MATFNLFLNASQADSAITNSYNLFHPDGLTGQNISLYGGNINHFGTINSNRLYITGGLGEESFINRLTGGIRVEGDCEFESIVGGISIAGTSYIENLTGGLNINNGGINVVGNSVNNGSFRNVGSVSITGPTSITGATRIVGNTEVLGNFNQSGLFNVVSNNAEFIGNLDVIGSLDVNGPFEVDGNTTITSTGGFTVSGPTTINGNSTLNGTTNIVGDLQLNGQPFITQQVNQITEVNYFLTGGECVELLTGVGGGGVVQTSNTGLVARNEGPITTGSRRGDFSVDLQLSRNSIVQVASGNYSVLVGGNRNKALGSASAVIGGTGNWSQGPSSSLMGGTGNWAIGSSSSIIGGSRNYIPAISTSSSIVGGNQNFAGGQASIVLGGSKNQASKDFSVALGTRAKTYNPTEIVQGSFYGQRGSMIGAFPKEGSPAFVWGDFNSFFPNSGLLIPSGTSFIKFRICKQINATTTTTPELATTTPELTTTTTTPEPYGGAMAFNTDFNLDALFS
jgi:hypothetical protein